MFDDLKGIEIYKGKTLEELLKIIVEHSLEERAKALEAYDFMRSELKSADEIFMIGDKPNLYLKIANDATETINKLLGSLNKLKELNDNGGNGDDRATASDFLDVLEKNNIGPARFFDDDVEEEKPKEEKKEIKKSTENA